MLNATSPQEIEAHVSDIVCIHLHNRCPAALLLGRAVEGSGGSDVKFLVDVENEEEKVGSNDGENFRTSLLVAMGISAEKIVPYDVTGRTIYVAEEIVWLAPPPCARCRGKGVALEEDCGDIIWGRGPRPYDIDTTLIRATRDAIWRALLSHERRGGENRQAVEHGYYADRSNNGCNFKSYATARETGLKERIVIVLGRARAKVRRLDEDVVREIADDVREAFASDPRRCRVIEVPCAHEIGVSLLLLKVI